VAASRIGLRLSNPLAAALLATASPRASRSAHNLVNISGVSHAAPHPAHSYIVVSPLTSA
jgi:hypothetical protein